MITVEALIEALRSMPPCHAVKLNIPDRTELQDLDSVIFKWNDYIELRPSERCPQCGIPMRGSELPDFSECVDPECQLAECAIYTGAPR